MREVKGLSTTSVNGSYHRSQIHRAVVGVQYTGHRTHASTPETNWTDFEVLSEVLNDLLKLVALKVAE